MQVTIELSDRQVKFLQWMIEDMKKFETINMLEDAVKECINMAMFDEGEIGASQNGM